MKAPKIFRQFSAEETDILTYSENEQSELSDSNRSSIPIKFKVFIYF